MNYIRHIYQGHYKKTQSDYCYSLCFICIISPGGKSDKYKWAVFCWMHWPCFSLLMKQKLESLQRLTNPNKCLIAGLLLVLIRKRMGLAGLSEVINIRGHKAMLIEWSPYCYAQGVSLSYLPPFSPKRSLSTLTLPMPFLSYASHRSPLETLYCRHWLFPPTALRKQALSEVDVGAAERV